MPLSKNFCTNTELVSVLVGFALIAVYGTGFVAEQEVLVLAMSSIAVGVGLDQYASRKLSDDT